MRNTDGEKTKVNLDGQRGSAKEVGGEGPTIGASFDLGAGGESGRRGGFKSRGGVSGGMLRQWLLETQEQLADIDESIEKLQRKRVSVLARIDQLQAIADQLDTVIKENP